MKLFGNKKVEAWGIEQTTAEVRRLMEAGKSKQAVELAKEAHKKQKTEQFEQLLVEAYLGRVEHFQKTGATEDARTLLNLVMERFAAHGRRLSRLVMQSAAVDDIDALVAPLASPQTTQEAREAIEAVVLERLVDLPGLAQCKSLPAGHPLKAAAQALWRAFEAVTSGPVEESQIVLAEVSRRSPLSGWKALVRALAAFHTADEATCRRALDAIPEKAAVRQLAAVIVEILEKKPPGTKLAGALHGRIMEGESSLAASLDRVEEAIDRQDTRGLIRASAWALRECEASRPDLCATLRQHIAIRSEMAEAPVDQVLTAVGPLTIDAGFWRLMAKGMEQSGRKVEAALIWEQFLPHAMHEGLLAKRSLEEAAVHLRGAEILSRLSEDEFDGQQEDAYWHQEELPAYYEGQPREIAKLALTSPRAVMEASEPGRLFRLAAEIDPAAETFERWWRWIVDSNRSDRVRQTMAEFWNEKRPGDPRPLLILSTLAEDRGALKLAMKHLQEAQKIDALNPEVRRAQLRLTMAAVWRHFKSRKADLVEKDIAELESMGLMGEGDRAAFLWMLKAVWRAWRQSPDEAKAAYDEAVRRIGEAPASILLPSLAMMAKIKDGSSLPLIPMKAEPEPRVAAETEARVYRLAMDLKLRVVRPAEWSKLIKKSLREKPCMLSQADILMIARAAANRPEPKLGYLATAVGLETATGTAAAWFLMLRAQVLPQWRGARITQCLRASLELASRGQDAELTEEIREEIDTQPNAQYALTQGRVRPINQEMLENILASERNAIAYPQDNEERDLHVVFYDDDDEGDAWDEDEEHDAQDEDESIFAPGGASERIAELVNKAIKKHGRLPPVQELMLDDPEMLAEMLAIAGGSILDRGKVPDLLREFLDNLDAPSLFGSLFGGGRKKRGKGKNTR